MSNQTAAYLTVVGGIILVVSAFLPWLELAAGFWLPFTGAMFYGGFLAILLGVPIAIMGAANLGGSREVTHGPIMFFGALGIALSVWFFASQTSPKTYGLLVVALGSVVSIAGGWLLWRAPLDDA